MRTEQTRIRDYIIEQQIGHGGFAEVYLCTHKRFLQKFVAKIIQVNEELLKSRGAAYASEISALSDLIHPNIIQLYEHFEWEHSYVLILEYCPNGSLHDEITNAGGLEMPRFFQIAGEIIRALAYCHERGIAHRDIKPGNVLMDASWRSKLADFGLSMRFEKGQLAREFSGSIEYTAPEIFQKKPHNPMAGDVWALGVLFAFMIGGKNPFESECLGTLKKRASQGVYKLDKRVPPAIAKIIQRMIVVNPDERITMSELAEHPLFRGTGIHTRGLPQTNFMLQKSQSGNMPQMERSDSFLWDEERSPFEKPRFMANSLSSLKCTFGKRGGVKQRVYQTRKMPTFSGTDEDVIESVSTGK